MKIRIYTIGGKREDAERKGAALRGLNSGLRRSTREAPGRNRLIFYSSIQVPQRESLSGLRAGAGLLRTVYDPLYEGPVHLDSP